MSGESNLPEKISLKEAKARGLNKYFTGRPCKHGHISERYLTSHCVACTQQWRADNRDKHEAAKARWQKANSEKHNAQCRKWRQANLEQAKQTEARWRERFRSTPEGKKKHSEEMRLRNRRMSIEVPPWADMEKIEFFYAEARRLTNETGIRHVVDHIIPINGEGVSGLHVHNNLQIMTDVENTRKGNRYDQ